MKNQSFPTFLIVFGLFLDTAWGVEREIPFSYDDTWVKSVRMLSQDGFSLSVTDKDSGIIQGSKSFGEGSVYFDPRSGYFVCPHFPGKVTSFGFHITLSIQEVTELSSEISTRARGFAGGFQNRKFFFFNYDSIDRETSCESTGALEYELLDKIFQPDSPGASSRELSLIRMLESNSGDMRLAASKQIFLTGVGSEEVYEAVADVIETKLDDLHGRSPKSKQQEIAWHAKALSCSGNQEYLPLLEKLSKSAARTSAKHARKAIKVLEGNEICN